ncbi:TetR/AcrR family transcriptional regulator [Streptomyces parvulus]|uniref:TetR/AcrR family transcriptional regulator n=1 Tax=Streptomyces parvulus TaxID=146923 RepID=A0A369V5M6_9ACTN|nr:TetR/AcrR family transcriptional regulator [Streptomyces parvulus]RDD88007.1 TetR/AcrR family transcriptional regulator [Streptomyces parvulus]
MTTATATRVRILRAAERLLGRDPDCALAEVAAAAGVARRTVYGHFGGRDGLVRGLVEEAAEAVRHALSGPGAPVPGDDPATALARFVRTLWPVGDRYGTLIALARRRGLDPDPVHAVLGPARDTVAAIVARGQRTGTFHTAVPAGVLGAALEAHLLTLLTCARTGTWEDDGRGAAVAALVVAGVEAGRAERFVGRGAEEGVEPCGGGDGADLTGGGGMRGVGR